MTIDHRCREPVIPQFGIQHTNRSPSLISIGSFASPPMYATASANQRTAQGKGKRFLQWGTTNLTRKHGY